MLADGAASVDAAGVDAADLADLAAPRIFWGCEYVFLGGIVASENGVRRASPVESKTSDK